MPTKQLSSSEMVKNYICRPKCTKKLELKEALVCFECKVFSSEKLGTYRAIFVGIKTSGGSRKYYDVCEVLRDMEENFVSVKAVLNNLLINAPCPYCEKEKEDWWL